MALTWPAKDPDEVLDYQVDWTDKLAGDTIATSAFTVVSAGGVVIDSQSNTTALSKVWLSGGTTGATAILQCRIATAGGRTFEETIALPIQSSADAEVVVNGWAEPTPGNLIALYPAFAAVPRVTVQTYLTMAGGSVDTTWEEADFPFAILALAAHFMEGNGLGTGAAAQAAASGAGAFKTMKSGALSLERFDQKDGASGFASSSYGQTYLRLLRRNRGGPFVTGAPIPAIDVYGGAQ